MMPLTPEGLAIAGTEIIAMALVRALLPDVAAEIPFTGTASGDREATALQLIRARLRRCPHDRREVLTHAARHGVEATAAHLHTQEPADVRGFLDGQYEVITAQAHALRASSPALADGLVDLGMAVQVLQELVPGMDADLDARAEVPAGVERLDAAASDPVELAVHTALLTAGMMNRTNGLQVSLTMLDMQASRLLPSPN
jgi:hypothetical protein